MHVSLNRDRAVILSLDSRFFIAEAPPPDVNAWCRLLAGMFVAHDATNYHTEPGTPVIYVGPLAFVEIADTRASLDSDDTVLDVIRRRINRPPEFKRLALP